MDRRLIAQWEAERLPFREIEYHNDVIAKACKDYERVIGPILDNGTMDVPDNAYQEFKLHAYALLKRPEIE